MNNNVKAMARATITETPPLLFLMTNGNLSSNEDQAEASSQIAIKTAFFIFFSSSYVLLYSTLMLAQPNCVVSKL